MILNAKVAHNLSNEIIGSGSDSPKMQIRQLRRIENSILRACRMNKKSIEYYQDISHSVWRELEQNGYNVKSFGTYDYNKYIISW